MTKALHASSQKVQESLKIRGFNCQVVELPQITRTAKEAAQAIGCRVEQIAKSLDLSTRTVWRRLHEADLSLYERLGGYLNADSTGKR